MHNNDRISTPLRSLAMAVVALALVGCPTDSPTAPKQQPPPPTGPSGAWNITVSSSPTSLEAGGSGSTITVSVRSAGTGATPPEGATVAILTTLGEFESAGSGVQSGFLSLINGFAQVAFFPGDNGGTAIIQVQLEESTGRITVPISQVAFGDFYVDEVDPSSGGVAGDDNVSVLGVGFAEPVRVFFGNFPAQVLSVASSVIRVLTPEAESATGGFVNVAVTIRFGTSEQETFTFTSGFRYDGSPQPSIFSVTPSFGSNDGGDTLIINGEGFDTASAQVLFGSGSVTSFDGTEGNVVSITETQIEVITPSATDFGRDLRNQVVDVLVRNVSGNGDILASGFTFGFQVKITAIEPLEGPYFGGEVVKVHGEGFDRQPLTVEYGGEVQEEIVHITKFIIRTVSEPILTQSCTDQSGPAIVTIIENGDQAVGATYTYQVVDLGPRITAVSPSEILQTGRRVTITGANLDPPSVFKTGVSVVSVTIGGRAVNVNSANDGQLVVTSPSFGDSFFDTGPCTTAGDEPGTQKVPTPADVQVINEDTTCEDTFAGSVLIVPTTSTSVCTATGS